MSQTVILQSEEILVVEESAPVGIITTEIETILVTQETEIVVLEVAEQGPPGRDSPNFVHTQSIAGSVWTVPHNLNRHPSVTTTDNLGNVIYGDVSYVDSNIVQITHGSALTGFAYCN